MPVETATYIDDLDPTYPLVGDPINQGDDHLRLIKSVLQNTFPSITAAVNATQTELDVLDGILATTAELNTMQGILASTAELNILNGATVTVAELNVLDGYLGSVTELNWLRDLYLTGVTAVEFDYLDGVTSNIQAQFDAISFNYPKFAAASDFVTLNDGNAKFVNRVSDNVTEGAWATYGPTGGTDIDYAWTALNDVPADADWIRVRCEILDSTQNSAVGDWMDATLEAKPYGSAISYLNEETTICAGAVWIDSGSNGIVNVVNEVTLPLNQRRFDITWLTDLTNVNRRFDIILVGYGYNAA